MRRDIATDKEKKCGRTLLTVYCTVRGSCVMPTSLYKCTLFYLEITHSQIPQGSNGSTLIIEMDPPLQITGSPPNRSLLCFLLFCLQVYFPLVITSSSCGAVRKQLKSNLMIRTSTRGLQIIGALSGQVSMLHIFEQRVNVRGFDVVLEVIGQF